MKSKIVLIVVSIFVITNIMAQSKLVRYSSIRIVNANGRGQKIYIDFGTSEKFNIYKDTTIISGLQKVHEMHNQMDAINYMNDIGWELLNFNNITFGYTSNIADIIFYFKRTFKPEDLK